MLTTRRIVLWRLALDTLPDVSAPDERFALAGADRVAELAVALRMSREETMSRLAWARCYAGRVEGSIATFGWVSLEETRLGEIRSTVRPGAGAAYVWHCETLPGFRGRGLYSALLRHITRELKASGSESAWIATLPENRPACRGVERAGFHAVLRVRYVQLRQWRTWRLKSLVSDGEEIEAARRVLRLGQLSAAPVPA